MIAFYQRLLRYDDWANHETLQSLHAASEAPERALWLMGHIVAAQWLWLQRMQQQEQTYPVWPDWPLDKIETHLPLLKRSWKVFLGDKKDSDLKARFRYTNSKGEPYSSTIGDATLHVAMHGSYHRGQIAQLLRQHGAEPAYTDFIQAARTEKI